MTKAGLQWSVATAALMLAGSAAAQTGSADPQTTSIDDVIVTAEKRDASLQDVPVAVSAFTSERRDELGVTTTQDIARFTPGMSYADFPNRVFLRGVGRFINTLGSDPGVATYSDGFYTSETAVIGLSPLFVDRVEVLRGPQGTLYGRNSIGGAVNVISRRPTADVSAEVRQTLGNYNTSITEGFVSGPITDRLRYRLAASKSLHDGYIENRSGPDQYEQDIEYYEAQLDFDLTDSFNIWLKYGSQTVDSTPHTGVQFDPYLTTTYFSGTSLQPSPTFGYTSANPGASDLYAVDYDYAGRLKTDDQHTVQAIATWDLDGVQLRYIGGWQTYDFFQDSDYDRTSRRSYPAFGVGPAVQTARIETIIENKSFFSHELNLSSTSDGPAQWIGGLYLYEEDIEQSYDLTSPNQAQLGTVLNRLTLQPTGLANPERKFIDLDAELESRSYAAFAQLDYDLSDAWRVTAGLRYTKDEKDGFERRRFVLWGPFTASSLGYGPFAPTVENLFATCCSIDTSPTATGQGPQTRQVSGEWDGWTGRLGVQWRPSERTLVYGNVSQGYKSGGFNLYGFTPAVEDEQLTAFEVGFKRTFDAPFQLNAAAFHYKYEDLQVPVKAVNGGLIQDNFINADEARSYGLELEAIWAPTDALQFLLSYSFLKAEFTDFCCALDVANTGAGLQDLEGATIPQSPENKLALNALYRFDFSAGALSLNATYSFVDDQYFSAFNTDRYRAPSYDQVDLRAVWDDAQDRYTLIGYLRNATDEASYNGLDIGPEDSGFARRVTVNAPRTFGVELQLRY